MQKNLYFIKEGNIEKKGTFDIASIQFAIHYANNLENVLKNISDALISISEAQSSLKSIER